MTDKNKLEVAGIKDLDNKISAAFREINRASEQGNERLEKVARQQLKKLQQQKKALVRKANR